MRSPDQVPREFFVHQYLSLLCAVIQWKTVSADGTIMLRTQIYMFCSDDRKHDGVYAAHCLARLATDVIPHLEGLENWIIWSICSDNGTSDLAQCALSILLGPHFAQTYLFYALGKLQLPSTLEEVRYAFDCPYHGASCSLPI